MFEPGDVVVVPFPFTDLTSQKSRPALVLSSRTFNRQTRDVIACALTSNLTNSPHSVLIGETDLVRGRLPLASRAKVGRLVTLDQRIIRKRVGRLRAPVLWQVYKELAEILRDEANPSPST
jgi:mRNA interferase MazF